MKLTHNISCTNSQKRKGDSKDEEKQKERKKKYFSNFFDLNLKDCFQDNILLINFVNNIGQGESILEIASQNVNYIFVVDDESKSIYQCYGGNNIISEISANNYGDYINYSVKINEVECNNWRIFYNDGKNIYLTLDGYADYRILPKDPSTNKYYKWIYRESWFPSDWTYSAGYSSSYLNDYVSNLTNQSIWSSFANDYAEYANGGISLEMWVNSWNAVHGINGTKKKQMVYVKFILINLTIMNTSKYFWCRKIMYLNYSQIIKY